MNRKHRVFWLGMLVSASICLTGCCIFKGKKGKEVNGKKNTTLSSSVCQGNTDVGFAAITCQPLDTNVFSPDPAMFKVEATGNNLVYQWYFRGDTGCGDPVAAGTAGGNTPELTVFNVGAANVGSYWCEIDSTDSLGLPRRTRTRDAFLGLSALVQTPQGNSTQVFSPIPASMPPGNQGSSVCGTHCGWINFPLSGPGYDPDSTASPALTKGYIQVRVGDNPGTFRLNNTYRVKWLAVPSGNSGCVINSTRAQTPANTEKEFPIDHTQTYYFTVYFVSSCPGQNAKVFLHLSFMPP